MRKTSILFVCMIALVAFVTWAPNASAMSNFNDAGAEGLSCAQCHPALADSGPADANHNAHAAPAGGDCNLCHAGGFNNPDLNDCVQCHGRQQDAGGDAGGIADSAGVGRGLRIHHQDAGASNCGLCHTDATGPLGVGENVPPAFYPGVGATPLNPCDGSEESFPSNTVSLDNDGDLLTDGADPDCAPANNLPVANDDTATTDEDIPVDIDVLLNDTDADNDVLTVNTFDATSANGGTVSCDTAATTPTPQCTYTPAAGFSGSDTFTYDATDGIDVSNLATVTITVNAVNNAPVANDDAASTPFQTAVDIDVLLNDTDADGDVLTVNTFDATSANGGAVSCDTAATTPTPQCTYTPATDFSGPDTFTYDATDGIDVSNRATVTVTVGAAANIPPVAVNDTASTPFQTAVDIDVLFNDTDADGDVLTVNTFDATSANGGAVSCDTAATTPTPQCTYTPATDFSGPDTFTYDATDGIDVSNRATVTVTVGAPDNNPPVANDDTATTDEDIPVDIDVLDNDTDADGDTLTVNTFDAASANGGTVSCDTAATTPTPQCTYTPPADFNGTDTFTYDATDGTDVSNLATVTITVNAVNDAPIAVDDAATTPFETSVDIDVLANDIDVDGDVLSINSFDVTSVAGGTVNCNGTCLYTPPASFTGVDTFTYDATDGIAVSNRATVTVTVGAAVNNPPVAVDDVYTTNEDTPLNVAAPGVLANDRDPDGDPITAMLRTGTANGNLALLSDGSFTYTPDPDFNGVDSFTYVANDGELDSNVATVTITVNAVNDAPIANDDTATTTVDTPVDIDVLANDFDVDGDTLSINDFDPTSTMGGTVSCGDTCLYTPPTGFTGNDTFTYDAVDPAGDVSNRATVTITVQDVAAIEAEIEVPGAINGANRGRTPVEIEFDDDNMKDKDLHKHYRHDDMQVEIAELRCGGNVSNAMAMPERIKAEDDDENEFVALFRTRDLELVCEDKAIVCEGTLADGTTFSGMDKTRVIRDFKGKRCKDKDKDHDDKHDRDDD